MAVLAQATHAYGVIGVEARFDELGAFERPMVGYGAGRPAHAMMPAAAVGSVTWAHASWIPRQHTSPREAMCFGSVWIAAA